MALVPAAYLCDTNLFAWIALRMISDTLSHGLSAPSAYAILVGVLMAGVLGRYTYVQVLADAAEAIHRRFPDPFPTARLDFGIASYLRCWVRPFAEVTDALARCYALGVQNGDLLNVSRPAIASARCSPTAPILRASGGMRAASASSSSAPRASTARR